MTELSLEIIEVSGSARLVLRGDLDSASASSADRALRDLLDRDVRRVVLDLRELDFIDSMGVKFLIDCRDRARELGVEIALAYGEGVVERVLNVSGVAKLFERHGDDRSTAG